MGASYQGAPVCLVQQHLSALTQIGNDFPFINIPLAFLSNCITTFLHDLYLHYQHKQEIT